MVHNTSLRPSWDGVRDATTRLDLCWIRCILPRTNTPPPPISMGMGWDGMFFYTGARPVRKRERDGMNRTLPNLPALSRSIDDDEYNTSRKRKDPTSTGTQPPPPFPQKEPHRHWFGLPHEGPQPSCLLMETTVLCLLTFIYLCHC